MLKYEDIHLSDASKRTSFIKDLDDNKFADGYSIVTSNDMKYKCSIASVMNEITNAIETTERLNDDTFKTDVIKVSSSAPTLSIDQIYFELTN